MFAPNPADLVKDIAKDNDTSVVQLGTISLEELNKYHCNNEERRLLSLFGIIFDVTSSEKGYGKNGACKFFLLLFDVRVWNLSDGFVFSFGIVLSFCTTYLTSHFPSSSAGNLLPPMVTSYDYEFIFFFTPLP